MAKYICFIYKITRHKYHNKKRKLATNEINKQYINNVIWCVSDRKFVIKAVAREENASKLFLSR